MYGDRDVVSSSWALLDPTAIMDTPLAALRTRCQHYNLYFKINPAALLLYTEMYLSVTCDRVVPQNPPRDGSRQRQAISNGDNPGAWAETWALASSTASRLRDLAWVAHVSTDAWCNYVSETGTGRSMPFTILALFCCFTFFSNLGSNFFCQ